MSDDYSFFDTQDMAKTVLDLGKCSHCGNHELFYSPGGIPYMWSKRDCCLPNALKRASAMMITLQDDPEKVSDYQLVKQDLRALTAEVQALLARFPNKRQALEDAKAKMKAQSTDSVDIVGRILRQMEQK